MNNIFYNNQFGFRENKSTIDAVNMFISKIIKNREKKLQTGALYLDLSKAFDSIDIDIFLSKIDRMGIRGICNDWFRSYLYNRKIVVKNGNYVSRENLVNVGCPQGSILGPLIMVCFTNDLSNHIEYCELFAYADDTTIYCAEKSLNLVKACLSHDIEIIQWFRVNKLCMNAQKTQFQLFTTLV